MNTADFLSENERFVASFDLGGLRRPPAKRLAIVTCMDARIHPIAALGLQLGDANVLRNAGAVVTQDVIRSLVVSNLLLGTRNAVVIGHTDCGMVDFDNETIRGRLASERGVDADALDFYPFADVARTVADGVRKLRESPLLDFDEVRGLLYDVDTGRLEPVEA